MKTINYHFKKGDLQICIKEQKECQILYFVKAVTVRHCGDYFQLSILGKMVALHFLTTSEVGHGCEKCGSLGEELQELACGCQVPFLLLC